MTQPAERPERRIVKPPKDSRLEALLCLYERRKREAADADTAFKELKAAILAELEGVFAGDERPSKAYDIAGTSMYPALAVSYKESEYLPASAIRDNFPDIYEQFKRVKPFSEVREVKSR